MFDSSEGGIKNYTRNNTRLNTQKLRALFYSFCVCAALVKQAECSSSRGVYRLRMSESAWVVIQKLGKQAGLQTTDICSSSFGRTKAKV